MLLRARLSRRLCSSLAPTPGGRDLVVHRPWRSIRDIVKYGTRTCEEERTALDARRTSEIFSELARVRYDTPRLQKLLYWYEEDEPRVGGVEHHHLLRAYDRCKLGLRAAAHIARMRRDGCTPNAAHCNQAIATCARYGGDGGADAAERLLEETLEVGLAVELPTYNAVLDACARSPTPERGWQLLERMRSNGLRLDAASFYFGLSACVRSGQPERSTALLAEIAAAGFTPPSLLDLYNDAIAECAHAGLPLRATARLADARHAGVTPDALSYNPTIVACAEAALTATALEVLAEMRAAGFDPSAPCREAVIRACARDGRAATARHELREMVGAGMRPSGAAYHLTIFATGADDEVRDTVDVLYVQAVRSSAVPLWQSPCRADLRWHNAASARAAVRCALRDYGRDLAAQGGAEQKLYLFTGHPEAQRELKLLRKRVERFADAVGQQLQEREAQLQGNLAALPRGGGGDTAPSAARLRRRLESLFATRAALAVVRDAEGVAELRAALEAARAVPRPAAEERIGTFGAADEVLGLASSRLQRLEPAAHGELGELQTQIAAYLEELGVPFERDRIGGNWLAISPGHVLAWCKGDPMAF